MEKGLGVDGFLLGFVRTQRNRVTGMRANETFSGWRLTILSSIIQNLSIGTTYGGFGVSVLAIQSEFGTNRAVASSALSFVLAAVTLGAPILGALYSRLSIRRTIIVGSLLAACGYGLLTVVQGPTAMLACYGLLIGPGVALTGTMPCNVLVMNWFVAKPGKALGIVNLPVFITIFPLVAVALLQGHGLRVLYGVMAAINLLILPVALGLVDRPSDVGQRPQGEEAAVVEAREGLTASGLTMRQLLVRGDFWLIVVVLGVIVGGGTMKLSHLVPLLVEQGHPIEQGSVLLSLSGAAGILGSLAFGFLADRFGGALVLMGNAIIQCAMWFIFLMPVSMPLLVLDAVVIGACGGGVSAAQGVLLNHRFGSASFGRALGVLSLATVPFLLGIGPLAGYLHDRTGSYRLSIILLIAASGLVAGLLGAFTSSERRQRRIEATA